jgi:hypothetical protein
MAQGWSEFAFLVTLMAEWKSLPESRQAELCEEQNPWPLCAWVTSIKGGEVRAFRHMILYFCYPSCFERICSQGHKKKIYTAFAEQLDAELDAYRDDPSPCALDRSILDIRKVLEREHETSELDFYRDPLRRQWLPDKKPPDPANGGDSVAPQTRFWVEKTLVRGRPDREQGRH